MKTRETLTGWVLFRAREPKPWQIEVRTQETTVGLSVLPSMSLHDNGNGEMLCFRKIEWNPWTTRSMPCLLLCSPFFLALFLFQEKICCPAPRGGERCPMRSHAVTSHSFKVASPKALFFARRCQNVKINYDFSFFFFHYLNM